MTLIDPNHVRGHLDSLILAALEQQPAHGWDICRRIELKSREALAMKEGSVYPALYRLEREKLIVGRWDELDQARRGPRRRVYRLTPKGHRQLAKARGQWHEFVTIMGTLLGAPA